MYRNHIVIRRLSTESKFCKHSITNNSGFRKPAKQNEWTQIKYQINEYWQKIGNIIRSWSMSSIQFVFFSYAKKRGVNWQLLCMSYFVHDCCYGFFKCLHYERSLRLVLLRFIVAFSDIQLFHSIWQIKLVACCSKYCPLQSVQRLVHIIPLHVFGCIEEKKTLNSRHRLIHAHIKISLDY